MSPPGHFSAEWGKSLKRRPLPHAPIPLKPFAILFIELVQNIGQVNTSRMVGRPSATFSRLAGLDNYRIRRHTGVILCLMDGTTLPSLHTERFQSSILAKNPRKFTYILQFLDVPQANTLHDGSNIPHRGRM